MKYLALMLIMLLVAYPVIELTKLIAVAGPYYWPDDTGMFMAEIAIIVVLYLAIIPVYLVSMRYMEKRWKR
jgi:hypothetical protein